MLFKVTHSELWFCVLLVVSRRRLERQERERQEQERLALEEAKRLEDER